MRSFSNTINPCQICAKVARFLKIFFSEINKIGHYYGSFWKCYMHSARCNHAPVNVESPRLQCPQEDSTCVVDLTVMFSCEESEGKLWWQGASLTWVTLDNIFHLKNILKFTMCFCFHYWIDPHNHPSSEAGYHCLHLLGKKLRFIRLSNLPEPGSIRTKTESSSTSRGICLKFLSWRIFKDC